MYKTLCQIYVYNFLIFILMKYDEWCHIPVLQWVTLRQKDVWTSWNYILRRWQNLSQYNLTVRSYTFVNLFLIFKMEYKICRSFPHKGDMGFIPGLERSLGERNDNPLQHSCLENAMDRFVWQTTVHGVTKELDTT